MNTVNFDEAPSQRMERYLDKIATGPERSKDLSRDEAEDALALILEGRVSPARAAAFLIAARMKRETLEENIGFWRALDRLTVKRPVNLQTLLQVADPFDGFDRAPYFGFYAIPVIAALGLPAYGHSALSLPPKSGITFENILHNHYGIPADLSLDRRTGLLEKHRFGYFGAAQTHPPLEGLRDLRREIVKRTPLSTFEKMLLPLSAASGGNFLATGYFHNGYEVPMLAVAELGGFDRVLLANGVEGGTFFAVHKKARLFLKHKGRDAREIDLALENMLDPRSADAVSGTWREIKSLRVDLATLATMGEEGLRGKAPAAPLIACHAAGLACLFGAAPDFRTAFAAAERALREPALSDSFRRFIADAAA